LAIVLMACSSSPSTATTPETPSGSDGVSPPADSRAETESSPRDVDDYPAYPNARSLSNGRVYGGPPQNIHISWITTASKDAPSVVVAHYEKVLAKRATSNGKTWSFNVQRDEGSTWVSRTLEIIPAGIAKDYPGGDVPPASGEQTVMLVSIAMGTKPAP
jgi:hypothetical protein